MNIGEPQHTPRLRRISVQNEIGLYMHCQKCLKEIPAGVSPSSWQQIEAGWTEIGFQVWCKRHQCNIIHVDFEGKQHPATDAWIGEAPGEEPCP